MSKRFDELFAEIVTILRRDYAGAAFAEERFDPRYYNQAIGQAWHDQRLNELLFLRYVNQMLACTGDRHLKLTMRPSESYEPWSCGFLTRRYGDALYVTGLTGEDRLAPGDRVVTVNGRPPAYHREAIQKNFFYADEPEREDWSGLLRMAEFIDVERRDGTRERLELGRYPRGRADAVPSVHRGDGYIILDLRNVPDIGEDELMGLLPLVCREDTPLSALTDTEIYVNYTRFNCLVKAAGLRGVEGAEEYIAELREKAGRGFLPESADDGAMIPGAAPERVAVLIDTWTRDGAEALALAARRAGAHLIGRPALGTLDMCGDVSYELDERYTLTWPTGMTSPAYRKERVLFSGVAPDAYIPWTPEELDRDILLERAVTYVEKIHSL